MIMLDTYKKNEMLLLDVNHEGITAELRARGEYPILNEWTFYGEPDVFPQFAISTDKSKVFYFELTDEHAGWAQFFEADER